MMDGADGLFDNDYLKRLALYEQALARRAGVFLREVRPSVFAWRCVVGHTHYGEMKLALHNGEFGMTMKDLPDEEGVQEPQVSEESEARTTSVDLTLDERIEQLLKDL